MILTPALYLGRKQTFSLQRSSHIILNIIIVYNDIVCMMLRVATCLNVKPGALWGRWWNPRWTHVLTWCAPAEVDCASHGDNLPSFREDLHKLLGSELSGVFSPLSGPMSGVVTGLQGFLVQSVSWSPSP